MKRRNGFVSNSSSSSFVPRKKITPEELKEKGISPYCKTTCPSLKFNSYGSTAYYCKYTNVSLHGWVDEVYKCDECLIGELKQKEVIRLTHKGYR